MISSPTNNTKHRRSTFWIGATLCVFALGVIVTIVISYLPSSIESLTERLADPIGNDEIRLVNAMLIEQISNYQPTTTFKSTVRGAPKSNSRQYSFIQPQQNDSVREFDSNYTIVTTAEGMEKEEFHGSLLKTNNTQLEWLHSLSFIDDVINSSRNSKRDWTYGWIQLLEPIPENELEQDLSLFESSVIGISGAMIRVKFPKNREYLKQIQKLSWIQGAGVQPTSTKISPDFDEELQNSSAATLHPLFITVMSVGDAEHYRQTIQNLGVKVGYFDPNIRVFEVVSPSSLISSLMTLDFVQFIEPIRIAKSNHDSAVQAMGVDSIRKIGETIGEFTGFNGSSIPIAVADTGLNTNHVSINSFRESICGENFVPGEDRDLWIDEETHGTHVTGTVAAVGYYQPLYAGMAPGVQDIRFAKVLNKKGFGSFSWVHRGMDFLAEHSSCPSEGWSDLKQQPLIVNMSLSAESLTFDAKESGARKLDSIVWSHRQLYTVAASNSNIHGYSNYGAAKNSLAVGASHDVGDVSSFSSHGPTVDGRLLPNVTGTGVGVISTLGNGSYDGYQALQGTSMSSPAVAGVAALIMEAAPAHQNHPALIRARLMASAIKPDPWFDSEVHFPSNNTTGPGSYHAAYGLGFVSARTSIVNLDDPNGWTSSGVTFDVDQNEVAYHDIDVPSGTSRLDVVLTWDEPTSDTIANVVLNDLDLFLDHEADCGTGACGEHSSQSSIDNVEWVIIRNPDPGTYRIKVSGSRVFTKLRGGLAWTIVRGDATPQLSINTDRQSFTSGGGSHVHEHTVELTVESSGYVATGTNLYIDCRTQDDTPCSEFGTRASEEQRNFSGSVNREDGLTLEQEDVGTFFLGEIAYGEEQSVTLHLFSSLAEDLNISFTTSAFNAAPSSTTVKFLVEDSDGAGLSDPEPPTNDASTSPMILDGPEGSIDIDTLVASTESGECGLFLGQRRVLRTLWYEWQPNSQDLVSFIASPQRNTPNWYAKEFAPRIDIFEVVGDEPGFTSLDHIATSPWSIQWFPKLESTYRIRVSNSHGSLPLTMSWFVGEQPVNDNFADALVLSGDSGTIDGHNLGATTEAGEEYGSLAASIWYQWEAPSDGTWEFQIKNAQVVFLLIFTGDTIDDLRLMSGVYDPGEKVALEAAAGEIYYLMVSSPDVNSGGWKFEELTWETSSSVSFDYGDSFENPWHFSDESFGSFTIHSTSRNTVEPDEPEVSGVQTTWAKWTAPESGIYTWYWNENPHRTNVMTGDSLDSLVATTYDDTSYSRHELLLDAEKDQEYYFSVGREKTDTDAFKLGSVNLHHFSWGIAPENNSMDGALLLTGSEGLIEGESRYATTAPIGLHRYGYSSLWYTFTAEEGGWYKFRLNSPWEDSYILAAFQQSDSDGELTVLGTSFSSYFLGQGVEILIHVEEGKSIFVRVGNKYNHNESSFTMNWEPTNAPQWMKFIGRLGNGFRDAANKVVNIRDPSDIQFDDSGRSMFVSTSRGILVFEREESSGLLTFIQELNEVPKDASLIWDYHRERLYVNEYRDWWVYKRKSNLDSMELELDYTFQDGISVRSYTWTNGPILHMENDGNYLYKFRGDFNRTKYGFTEEGKLKQLQFRRNLDFALVNLQPHVNGSHWYSLNSNSARLVRRDVGGGDLRFVSDPEGHTLNFEVKGQTIVEDEYFFSVDAHSWYQLSLLLSSANLRQSKVTNEIHKDFNNLTVTNCFVLLSRPGVIAIDIFCNGGLAVFEYLPDSNDLVLQDFVKTTTSTIPDRFGRAIPGFTLPDVSPVEESPDRKHVYVSTRDHGILSFERIGIEPLDLGSLPPIVKRLDLLKIADNTVEFGSNSIEDGCLEVTNLSINNVSYTVNDSKWQHRDEGSDWVDIEGSNETEQICSKTLEETKEYRVVATISVDGESAEYASNFIGKVFYDRLDELVISEGQVELDALSTDDCMEVSDITINSVTYSVEISQWQSRSDSDDEWITLEETMKTRELCVYAFDANYEYQLVGTFIIDGERGYFKSNVFVSED